MVDEFKRIFKKYKRKVPAPDFSDVIDTSQHSDGDNDTRVVKHNKENWDCSNFESDLVLQPLGLIPVQEWKIFSLPAHPGFLLINNPFKPLAQRYWMKRCMEDFPCNENVTNLGSSLETVGDKTLWRLHQEHLQQSKEQKDKKTYLQQLRWVTLGYHYDWNNKVYNKDSHTPFPEDLWLLASVIARTIGYPSFNPQTAIVNVYNMDSTLGGHNDHSELDHDAPLISFSFGQSAIFLLGGSTKAVEPDAIYLNSGDIIIMAGPARLAFHGVPRIIKIDDVHMHQSWGEPEKPIEDEIGSFCESSFELCKMSRVIEERSYKKQEKNENKRLKTGEHLENNTKTTEIYEHQPTTHSCHDNSRSDLLDKCNTVRRDMNKVMRTLCDPDVWRPYMDHMMHSRLNISVRQVTGKGKDFDSVT